MLSALRATINPDWQCCNKSPSLPLLLFGKGYVLQLYDVLLYIENNRSHPRRCTWDVVLIEGHSALFTAQCDEFDKHSRLWSASATICLMVQGTDVKEGWLVRWLCY